MTRPLAKRCAVLLALALSVAACSCHPDRVKTAQPKAAAAQSQGDSQQTGDMASE